MLIVAGVDRSGKTTLVRRLRGELDCVIYKGEPIDNQAMVLQHVKGVIHQAKELADAGKLLICDRFQFPDDLVYREIVTGEPPTVMAAYRKLIEADLRRIDAAIIYLTADFRTIRQRYHILGDDEYLELKKVPEIIRRYEEVLSGTSIDILRVDTSQMSADEVLAKVLDFVTDKWGGRFG